MKQFNKRSLLLALLCIVIAYCAQGSIAYFTSKDIQDTIFTIGEVDIKVIEPSWDSNIDHIIKPLASYDKDPIVVNIGSNDAYVRMHVTISDYDVFSKQGYNPMDMVSIDDSWVIQGSPKVKGNTITYTYAYTQILEVGNQTKPLFNKVTIPGFVDNEIISQMENEFDIDIQADAIQTQGFSNYQEAMVVLEQEKG